MGRSVSSKLLALVLLLAAVFPPPAASSQALAGPLQAAARPALIASPPASSGLGRQRIADGLHRSDLMFVENVGQFDRGARFQVHDGKGTLWLAEDAIWLTLLEPPTKGAGEAEHRGRGRPADRTGDERLRGVHLKLSFPGANPRPAIEPFDRLETKVSYFVGSDPEEWRPDVPVWGGVRYRDLYPGIDLELTSRGGRLAPRMVANEGANLRAVRFRVQGATALRLDGDHLSVTSGLGEYALPLLEALDRTGAPLGLADARVEVAGDGVAQPFAGAVARAGTKHIATAGANAALIYSTYLGGSAGYSPYGSGSDQSHGVAVDQNGAAYLTGQTYSSDFPTTPGSFEDVRGGYIDAFVAKLNVDGSTLAYATFLGGVELDRGYGITVDDTGAAFVAGSTCSRDFPTTPEAYDSSYNGGNLCYGGDVFLAKLSLEGTALEYGTFLGGESDDLGYGVAVDGHGAAYLTGQTHSVDFPRTAGAFDRTYNGVGGDAFIAKLSADGSSLVYGTFLGGSSWGYGGDYGNAIAVDGAGAAYVTGHTSSSDFPTTPGAFDGSFGGWSEDAFVAKLSADGSALVYSTFLGGGDSDYATGVAVDRNGAAYVTGLTESSDFPTTPGALQRTWNGGTREAFVAKLSADGSALAYATFLGGSVSDWGNGIAVDGAGAAYVTGYTRSSDFPTTTGAFDRSYNGGEDAFVAKLNVDGSALIYGSFLGGGDSDYGNGIAVDADAAAYVAGLTESSDFPTTASAFDRIHNGAQDAFVAKLATPRTYSISGRIADPEGAAVGGVTVSTGSGASAMTAGSGAYTISGLAAGVYALAPSKTSYTFSPASRTVTVPPDATGRDFAAVLVRPGIEGSLSINVPSTYNAGEPVIISAWVTNRGDSAREYDLVASLLRDGSRIASMTEAVWVPAGVNLCAGDLSFGVQAAGIYEVVAELRLGGVRLQERGPISVRVLRSTQDRAISLGARLRRAADRELDEMRDLVAGRYADSLSNISAEALSFLVGGQAMGWLGKFGELMSGFSVDDLNNAAVRVMARVLGVRAIVVEPQRGPIADKAKRRVEEGLSAERSAIATRQHGFEHHITSLGDFEWPDRLGQVAVAHLDSIANRTEGERVVGFVSSWRHIGYTTLREEDVAFEVYQRIYDALGWIVLALSVVVLMIAGLAAVGLSLPTLGASVAAFVALLPQLAAVIAGTAKFKLAMSLILVFFAVAMHTQAEVWVAPAVTRELGSGLDALRALIAASDSDVRTIFTNAAINGRSVVLSTELSGSASADARPLIETYIYSVDGRVVDIISRQPQVSAVGTAIVEDSLIVRPGRYKAVTVAHSGDRVATAADVLPLEIAGPSVQLGVSLASTALSPGQPVRATIVITNVGQTATGDFAVIAEPSNEQGAAGWVVGLDPGARRQIDHTYVPQATGGYYLQVRALGTEGTLAERDVAYVVGSGSALALNTPAGQLYPPGAVADVPVFVSNAGNVATSTVVSLVTLDRLHGGHAVHTDTVALEVPARSEVAATLDALPAELAVPGLYTSLLLVAGSPYRTLDFAIAAEGTLFSDLYPDTAFHAVGDIVTVTAGVVDSTFAYTEAAASLFVLQPDGITTTLSLTPTATGRFESLLPLPITGTYLLNLEVSRTGFRSIGASSSVVAERPSELFPSFEGRALVDSVSSVTVTVRNELGMSVQGATFVLSGTTEYRRGITDRDGTAVLQLSPIVTDSYQFSIERAGFARTETDLPVWTAADVTPPVLSLHAPDVTNRTPLTVTGVAEPGASLAVNGVMAPIDAGGHFTTGIALSGGQNVIVAVAEDAGHNSTTVTRTVSLDRLPPALTVTYPGTDLLTARQVVSVTGAVEGGASVFIGGTLAKSDTSTGAFTFWTALITGSNRIPIVAVDEAGNTAGITRTIGWLPYDEALPSVLRNAPAIPHTQEGLSSLWHAIAELMRRLILW